MTRPSRVMIICILSFWLALGSSCGTKSRQGANGSQVGSHASSQPLENLSVDPDDDELPRRPVRRTGLLSVACEFDDGWYAVLPKELAGEQAEDEYLMQALIGLTEEPKVWESMPDYKKLQPHAATRCGHEPVTRDLKPGEYVLFIGWAGQFERTGYENNGRIEPLSVTAGQDVERRITVEDLDADLPCISCPFLLVWRAGEFVELGQILIDRYSASKQGADSRSAVAEVVGGRVAIKLAEREPEVSHIDAIEVWHNGRRLPAIASAPGAVRAVDGHLHRLAMGEELTMHFQAPIQRGELNVEIRVNGYYILDRARP